ncbi:hypothetical protein LMG22037_05327 [Paraburkholderia phenoliruptrix]|uniref:Uncharacterized protein n=1 Tax=Paraburkholderia phenoliruptrix TaxID=252970 RepID=A0A6J5C737_9BURK|nr:hypothetical protein LMG22037_05327 [Paraburkholderia phenoliruptrix]
MGNAVTFVRENWMLLAVPACAALAGYMLGRLLRSRK